MILNLKRLPNHRENLHAKRIQKHFEKLSHRRSWSSGHYHDQNYVNMTKMNVPGIFSKKNAENILKNCPIVQRYCFCSQHEQNYVNLM